MSSLRIRALVLLYLVSLSCSFTVPRPASISSKTSHHLRPAPFLTMSTQPSEEQDTVVVVDTPESNNDETPTNTTTTSSSPSFFDPELRRIMTSVATLGVLETAFLTYSKLSGPSLDICGTAGDCASVLNGPYSVIPYTNDIPLASLGLVAYLVTAYLSLEPVMFEKDDTDANRIALLAVTTAMGTFSVFLMSLVYGVLQTSCLYCLASACFSMTLASCTWFGGCLPTETEVSAKRGLQAGLASFVATTLAAVLLFVSVDPPNEANMSLVPSSPTPTTKIQQEEMSPPSITTSSSARAMSLSQDLQSLNAKLYGAYWCSHCYDQKQSLGKQAFARIQYLECAPEGKNSQRELCKERDVPGYPTWEIDGKLYPGEREIVELEDIVKELSKK